MAAPKILLTHAYFLEEDEKEKQIMKPYPPLGILYISAYLEQHNYDNDVFDSTFNSFIKWQEQVINTKPDIIAIYTNLMTKLNVLRMIKFVRSQKELSHTKIVLGGPEVKNHIDNFLKYGADIIVFGEGEETMLELVKHFHFTPNNDLTQINGIAYLKEKTKKNPDRALRKDINELPFPNRKKIDLNSYFEVWKDRHGHSVISLSTMRGCPYTCKWCSRAVYGGTYRRRSAVKVVDEIQSLQKNYNFDMIWFVDDVFTINHKWLKEFVSELEKRKVKITYEIITRADRMNEDIIQLLKKSGCFRIWIGAESGSQRVIDAMDRRVDVNQVREMIRLTQKHGIQAGTFIMVGYPGETYEDIKETIHHLKVSNPEIYTITVAYPIKGTPLYAEVEDRFIDDLPWETSTDRDIDFKRTYKRKYYNYVLKWLFNEVAFHKQRIKNPFHPKLPLYKLKSIGAQVIMRIEK